MHSLLNHALVAYPKHSLAFLNSSLAFGTGIDIPFIRFLTCLELRAHTYSPAIPAIRRACIFSKQRKTHLQRFRNKRSVYLNSWKKSRVLRSNGMERTLTGSRRKIGVGRKSEESRSVRETRVCEMNPRVISITPSYSHAKPDKVGFLGQTGSLGPSILLHPRIKTVISIYTEAGTGVATYSPLVASLAG